MINSPEISEGGSLLHLVKKREDCKERGVRDGDTESVASPTKKKKKEGARNQ